MKTLLTALALAVGSAQTAGAGQRVVLFGGGEFPPKAVDRFMEAAGGEKARLLMVTWASGAPREEVEEFKDYMAPWKPASLEVAPSTRTIHARRKEFLRMLDRATGVFFTGGDQVRITAVLDREKGFREALKKRYREGVVFGGSSAGTAVMSEVMITGEGNFEVIDGSTVEVRQGLGLLPPEVIVDQHFILRQRENRLFGLVLKHPGSVGLGVDEPCALVVDDGRFAQAFGPTYVMTVEPREPAPSLFIGLLGDGARYDIKERRRL